MGDLWKRLTEGQKRVVGWLAVILAVGVGLLVLQPPVQQELPSTAGQQAVEASASPSLKEELERDLAALLNRMLGGKQCQVLLTMDGGPSLTVAENRTEEERYGAEGLMERRITSTPVILRSDAERREVPLVLEQVEPRVRGVLVVLEREADAAVRLAVAQAVSTVLQVPMYRIEVLFKQ